MGLALASGLRKDHAGVCAGVPGAPACAKELAAVRIVKFARRKQTMRTILAMASAVAAALMLISCGGGGGGSGGTIAGGGPQKPLDVQVANCGTLTGLAVDPAAGYTYVAGNVF